MKTLGYLCLFAVLMIDSIAAVELRRWLDLQMERETRIELATNSLEGCDSTIELLPRW